MHIWPCPCAVGMSKKIWNQTYFEPMRVDSVEIFHRFAFWHHGSKLASFFTVLKNCIFWGASFKLINNLATLDPVKLQAFYRTLLYHCYTLHTATHCKSCLLHDVSKIVRIHWQIRATHCNELQHTATHCNTLQHTAAHRETLQHTVTHCSTPQPLLATCVF